MMLDLRNTNALMFKNSASGKLNMIYRRDDGNIGWVEPPRPLTTFEHSCIGWSVGTRRGRE